jgi:hypothetical protein
MKKIILALLVVLFFSCKSKSVTNTSLDNKTERSIKGNWSITSVSYPGSDYIKVTSFNLADSQCFVGSQWSFVSNNNKGEMALNNSKCTTYGSRLTWFVNKDGNMVIKFLEEGTKAKHTTSGYVLSVRNASEQSFQLVDKINVGGKITDVVYQFEKSNN